MWHAIACAVAIATAVLAAFGCGGGSPNPRRNQPEPLRVAFLMDTVAHERWKRDRELFIERIKERGAEPIVEVADGDSAKQLAQAQALLEKGVNVLVVIPHDAQRAGAIVEAAKARNVPVVSYDRLIWDADIDMYVSFDNVRVGEMQAQYLASRAPSGNYVLIGGAPTDHNAQQLREGQMKALKPLIDRRAIRIVSQGWATDWSPAEARKLTENALNQTKRQLAAVVASNDVTAGGAVEALAAANLAGKVLVSGQDAELDAVQRIVAGTQAMTVYKPVRSLARLAAEAAVKLAMRQDVPTVTAVNNGRRDVPAMLLPPISVDKDTIDTLIRDGFHTREAVYGAKQ